MGVESMSAIYTENLTKQYKDVLAVDRLNLTIEQGELFTLLGMNGAGKTTTVHMLTGLTVPTSGDAKILGKSIRTDAVAIKGEIGVSPQETAVAPQLTVRENLELICGIYGFDRHTGQEKIRELADRFALPDVLDRKAGKLSGGWQRRVSIAMALIGEPSVLFLDEPTLGLDVLARRELWDVIRTLKGRITVVMTTHYMEEAQQLSDKIGILKDGRLLIAATPTELMERTSTETVEQAFIAVVKEGKV